MNLPDGLYGFPDRTEEIWVVQNGVRHLWGGNYHGSTDKLSEYFGADAWHFIQALPVPLKPALANLPLADWRQVKPQALPDPRDYRNWDSAKIVVNRTSNQIGPTDPLTGKPLPPEYRTLSKAYSHLAYAVLGIGSPLSGVGVGSANRVPAAAAPGAAAPGAAAPGAAAPGAELVARFRGLPAWAQLGAVAGAILLLRKA